MISLLTHPGPSSGFFYNVWHSDDARWHKTFSPVSDCPDIDPDFLCLFQQPADRLFTIEMLDEMNRF